MVKNKVTKNNQNEEKDKKEEKKNPMFPQNLISMLADEVAKTVVERMPHLLQRQRKKTKPSPKPKKVENAMFLDTSAIIDGRIFDVVNLGLINNILVIPESILLELKRIADSQDAVKRERGRKGLEMLEKLKKTKGIKLMVMPEGQEKKLEKMDVDEKLFYYAKINKGRIITCDYNLEKKANIQGVFAINVNALANCLKVTAVPGESLHIKVQHVGKDANQGVGYLDDGTMIVIENGSNEIGLDIDVVISRVIQTSAGRILFAKKI
ncbi:hypothetical protein C4559_02155 [Candidatus Microgenomates bacterium]|nr:MAG: hypothetical protein C4559_02155 [Candidatus Microgenomates bacterium]